MERWSQSPILGPPLADKEVCQPALDVVYCAGHGRPNRETRSVAILEPHNTTADHPPTLKIVQRDAIHPVEDNEGCPMRGLNCREMDPVSSSGGRLNRLFCQLWPLEAQSS